MIFLFQPLLQEDHHEHGSHYKVQPLCAEMDQASEDPAQSGSEKPVKMIQQGNENINQPRSTSGGISAV